MPAGESEHGEAEGDEQNDGDLTFSVLREGAPR